MCSAWWAKSISGQPVQIDATRPVPWIGNVSKALRLSISRILSASIRHMLLTTYAVRGIILDDMDSSDCR